MATPEILNDPKWLADSGATNHVTADGGNLAIKSRYSGNDSLIVGNGTRLGIEHTGSSAVLCGFKLLKLNNMLHVPNIKRNLVSMPV